MKSLGIDTDDLLAAAPAALRNALTRAISDSSGSGERLASIRSAASPPLVSEILIERGEKLAGIPRDGDGTSRTIIKYSEEVVIREAAPVFRVSGNKLDMDGKAGLFWEPLLTRQEKRISEILPSVGRVEARLGGNDYVALGTAWVTGDGLLITNRHVARYFAQYGRDGLIFRQTIPGSRMACRIDFSDQPANALGVNIPADGILFTSKEDRPDIAVMRLAEDTRGRFPPLTLRRETLLKDDCVAAIGFPQRDERARPEDIRRAFGDIFDCKRFAPGFVKSVTSDTIVHLCSTLGGNSGSPIIELGSGQVAGIHFGGYGDSENYAEPASTIYAIIAGLLRESPRPAPPSGNSGEAAMRSNSITVTIPVTITVEIGQPVNGGAPSVTVAGVDSPAAPATLPEAVAAAKRTFGNYQGVVDIRAGWKFRNGWITDEPAVVIAVNEKKAMNELAATGSAPLPERIGRFAVDIKPASPFDLLPELRGDTITESSIRQGTYKRDPKKFPLDPAERKIKGMIHIGPDAGQQMLADFLKDIGQTLTVGMYDFTAPHIVKAVKNAIGDDKRMTMVLQQGESIDRRGTKKYDRPDAETVAALSAANNHFTNQWASVGAGRVFPYAYHIKVAVRDSTAVWLSSGNWQSSNQPPFDRQSPVDAAINPFLPDTYNREWHVVLHDKGIAKQFEDHILQDAEDAKTALESVAADDPVIWIDSLAEAMAIEEARPEKRYFLPYEIDRKIKVQPILTPDNYPALTLALIRSAKNSILFQNQSFNIIAGRDNRFTEMLDAMKEKQKILDDVRIIIRADFAREQIEKMKDYGFDVLPGKVRLQKRCHAKTIIVDDRFVLIGSHNFTNSGTTANRDASYLFDDAGIAAYCREIYEYDWLNRSEAAISEPRRGARITINETASNDGMEPVRLSELGLL